METLVIMRGPSGSGKSTFAEQFVRERTGDDPTQDRWSYQKWRIFAADEFFIQPDGEYVWDAYKLPEAHQWNFSRVLEAMQLGIALIIVDNTFTRTWEYKNYQLAGELAGYKIVIVEFMVTTVEEILALAERNEHNVPAAKIFQQVARFEPAPDFLRDGDEKIVKRVRIDA